LAGIDQVVGIEGAFHVAILLLGRGRISVELHAHQVRAFSMADEPRASAGQHVAPPPTQARRMVGAEFPRRARHLAGGRFGVSDRNSIRVQIARRRHGRRFDHGLSRCSFLRHLPRISASQPDQPCPRAENRSVEAHVVPHPAVNLAYRGERALRPAPRQQQTLTFLRVGGSPVHTSCGAAGGSPGDLPPPPAVPHEWCDLDRGARPSSTISQQRRLGVPWYSPAADLRPSATHGVLSIIPLHAAGIDAPPRHEGRDDFRPAPAAPVRKPQHTIARRRGFAQQSSTSPR